MGSAPSVININLDARQPFVAGQHVTGIAMFNNTLGKTVKCQRIYAQFVGEVVYTTERCARDGVYHVTHREPFLQQLINLEERQDIFALENDHYLWPMSFSLPKFLPPSLDQLSPHGPYIRYTLRVVFERPGIYRTNICRKFRILVIASPSSYLQPRYPPAEVKNKNRSNVTVRAALVNGNRSLAPGNNFLLNIELHNPNHNTIKSLSVNLIQHRIIAMGGHCKQTIPLLDLPHLREFSGENYRETLQMTIPDDDRIIPSFLYVLPTFSELPIAVQYWLELEAKTHGLFKDFILTIPIVLHSMEMYMPPSDEDDAPSAPDEEEEPPPPYDLAIATH